MTGQLPRRAHTVLPSADDRGSWSTSTDARALTSYAGICGYLPATGHARTSGASMTAGHLGGVDVRVSDRDAAVSRPASTDGTSGP